MSQLVSNTALTGTHSVTPHKTRMRFLIIILQFELVATFAKSADFKGIYPGDILLGGLFPIHGRNHNGSCDSTRLEIDGLFGLEAFYYSLDQMNKHLKSCCGFTVGAVTLDTCLSDRKGLLQALKFVVRRLPDLVNDMGPTNAAIRNGGLEIIGVVGPMASGVTVQVANLLGMFKIPQISYAATSPALSSSAKYPYFLRTVPSDFEQASALVRVLKHFNWSYAVGVFEDSSYGMRGFQVFAKLAAQSDICFADTWKIDVDHPNSMNSSFYESKLKQIHKNKPSAHALVLYLTPNFAHRIFAAVKTLKLDHHFIFIGTDGWGSRYVPSDLDTVVQGAIATHPVNKEFPDFSKYFFDLNPKKVDRRKNPWFEEFWKFHFRCKSTDKGCSENHLSERVEGTEFGYMHFIRDAVFAYGVALKKIFKTKCGHRKTKGLCKEMKAELRDVDSQLLIDSLRKASFLGIDGKTVQFVREHDGAPIFSVMEYVGRNRSRQHFWREIATITVNAKNRQTRWTATRNGFQNREFYPESVCGRPCDAGHTRRYHHDKCCWRCEPCEFPTYKFNESTCVSCLDRTQSALTPPFYQPNLHRNACEVVRIRIVGLCDPFILAVAIFAALGLLLTFVTLGLFVFYASTPIIKASSRELSVVLLIGILLCYANVFLVVLKPNIYSCAFIRFLYSISYTVCYAAIFTKTNRIARIFRLGSRNNSPKKTKYISPMSQLVAAGFLVGFQCILNTVWLILRKPTPDYRLEINHETESISAFYFCEAFEDEDMIVALVLPAILLILSAIYAFKARKCPGKFNETKYIIITTYTTCVVWIAFIPVFFTTEKIPVRVFALCAAQALNATVTLFCLFLPKLYVALFRPHKNTRDAVMGRRSLGSLGSWVVRKPSTGGAPNSENQSRKLTVGTLDSAANANHHEMKPVIFSNSGSDSSDSEGEIQRKRGEKRALSKSRKSERNSIDFADDSE